MMKQRKKIRFIFLTLILACLCMTGCSKTAVEEEAENKAVIEEENLKSVEDFTNQAFVQNLNGNNYQVFQSYHDGGSTFISPTFDNDFAQRWKTFDEKHGTVAKAEIINTTKTENGYTCKIVLTGTDNQEMALTIHYDRSCKPLSTTLDQYTDDSNLTIADKMEQAGGNIAVGLGVVFIILVALSLLISLFRHVNRFGSKKPSAVPEAAEEESASGAAVPKNVPVQNPTDQNVSLPLQDNGELMAVIAAAVAAQESASVSPNGYVVRSIRRLKSNKWC